MKGKKQFEHIFKCPFSSARRRPQATAARGSERSCSSPEAGGSASVQGCRGNRVTYFKKDLVIPTQLVNLQVENKALYTLRFSTSSSRGSGLDEPAAGINVCLIGEDGQSFLHNIPPLVDTNALDDETLTTSEVAETKTQANKQAINSAQHSLNLLPISNFRFQRGSVDDINFHGPRVGKVQSIIVAPEEGSWNVDEITVSSSQPETSSRFVLGDSIGARGGVGYLAAVPQDAIVYGCGESAVFLTKAEAKALHEDEMERYRSFKERLLQVNAVLVGAGTGLAWAISGGDAAVNFAVGGAGGLLYQWLLQKGVDGISFSPSPLYQKTEEDDVLKDNVVTPRGVRVAFLGILLFCALYCTKVQGSVSDISLQSKQVVIGAAGFLMYKVALVGVLVAPPLPQWKQSQDM